MTGTTAVHVCFGYAVIIHERPSAYSFLPELAQSSVKWVSIETAQFKLDCSILKSLPDKAIILSVLDLSTHEVETLEMLAARIGRALPPDRQADQALAAAVMAMIARHTSAHLAVHLHAGLTRPDFADLLPAISCPMLICAGEKDTMRPVAVHQDMAARIPSSHLTIIPGGGHMIATEYPEQVTMAMRSWLES